MLNGRVLKSDVTLTKPDQTETIFDLRGEDEESTLYTLTLSKGDGKFNTTDEYDPSDLHDIYLSQVEIEYGFGTSVTYKHKHIIGHQGLVLPVHGSYLKVKATYNEPMKAWYGGTLAYQPINIIGSLAQGQMRPFTVIRSANELAGENMDAGEWTVPIPKFCRAAKLVATADPYSTLQDGIIYMRALGWWLKGDANTADFDTYQAHKQLNTIRFGSTQTWLPLGHYHRQLTIDTSALDTAFPEMFLHFDCMA